jgi:hypothetical protein
LDVRICFTKQLIRIQPESAQEINPVRKWAKHIFDSQTARIWHMVDGPFRSHSIRFRTETVWSPRTRCRKENYPVPFLELNWIVQPKSIHYTELPRRIQIVVLSFEILNCKRIMPCASNGRGDACWHAG